MDGEIITDSRRINEEIDNFFWNNQDITTEGKSLYWKHWVASGIYFIHDILNEQGKYLTYEEFKCKYKTRSPMAL